MGINQSNETSGDEGICCKKASNYVEQLLHLQRKNYLHSNSLECKEVMKLRRERVLKILRERKAIKPYALQLLEARAAAKRQSQTAVSSSVETVVGSESSQRDRYAPQEEIKPPDLKSKILQRLAAHRKFRQSQPSEAKEEVEERPVPVNSTTSTQTEPHDKLTPLPSASTQTAMSPKPSVPVATASIQTTLQREPVPRAEPPIVPAVDRPKATTEARGTMTRPQPTSPPAPKLTTSQPPLTPRQSVSAMFSRPSPPSSVSSRVPPTPPSLSDLMNEIEKNHDNQKSLLDWKPTTMEEKLKYGINNTITALRLEDAFDRLHVYETPPLDLERDSNCGRKHLEVVDRLHDSLIAGWEKGSGELSLLDYQQQKGIVPHRPLRKDGFNCSGGLLEPSYRSVHSKDPAMVHKWGQRCSRHQPNKNIL